MTRKFALVERAMAAHAAMERQLVSMLSPEQQAAMATMLGRMIVLDGAAPPFFADLPPSTEQSLSRQGG